MSFYGVLRGDCPRMETIPDTASRIWLQCWESILLANPPPVKLEADFCFPTFPNFFTPFPIVKTGQIKENDTDEYDYPKHSPTYLCSADSGG